jgi:hypothetical protein
MEFVTYSDGSIGFDKNPIDEAQLSFREKRYLEAFDIVLFVIDFLMVRLYQRYEQKTNGMVSEEYSEYQNLNFRKTLRNIRDANLISNVPDEDPLRENKKSEFQRLLDFFDMRNRVVHRVMFGLQFLPMELRDHRPDATTVDFEDAKDSFDDGLLLVGILDKRFSDLGL